MTREKEADGPTFDQFVEVARRVVGECDKLMMSVDQLLWTWEAEVSAAVPA
jgi:hypothetical protein